MIKTSLLPLIYLIFWSILVEGGTVVHPGAYIFPAGISPCIINQATEKQGTGSPNKKDWEALPSMTTKQATNNKEWPA